MAADFAIQANDLLPSIQGIASTKGAPVDLTNATSVRFIMRSADAAFVPSFTGGPKVNAAAVFDGSKTGGGLRYDWTTGDTATPGNYVAQFSATFPGAKPQTFPTTTYITITILADLDGAA